MHDCCGCRALPVTGLLPAGRAAVASAVGRLRPVSGPLRLAGCRFAVPMSGAHVRRVFDERCRAA